MNSTTHGRIIKVNETELTPDNFCGADIRHKDNMKLQTRLLLKTR